MDSKDKNQEVEAAKQQPAPIKKQDKKARLSEALRNNLRRRKEAEKMKDC